MHPCPRTNETDIDSECRIVRPNLDSLVPLAATVAALEVVCRAAFRAATLARRAVALPAVAQVARSTWLMFVFLLTLKPRKTQS